MFPTELPAELVILILSYVPLSSVSALSRLNREWYNFIQGNDMNRETIYRDAAFYEGFVPKPAMLLEDLSSKSFGTDARQALYSARSMACVNGWKDFCRNRKMIELAWTGRAPSHVIPSPRAPGLQGAPQTEHKRESMHYRRVHRIKVDEKVGITMATTLLGGLIVRDLETDIVLWELPVWYVRGCAHLEYGEGYLIFDRDDGNKEVWRRTADIPASSSSTSMDTALDGNSAPANVDTEPEVDVQSLPDERQRHVTNYISHLTSFNPTSSNPASTSTSDHPIPTSVSTSTELFYSRARFSPHAVLHMPEPTRAYRFVYPHLLVASLEKAFVWDVKAGKIVQTVDGIQVIQPIGGDAGTDGGEGEAHDDEDWYEHQDTGEGPSSGVAAGQDQSQGPGLIDDDLAAVADFLLPPTPLTSTEVQSTSHIRDLADTQSPADEGIEEQESDLEEEEDDDDDDNHQPQPVPQFLGLVRYVDISPRHLFFAGRYLLRVFSRATGKCVLDIPSTRWRYGRWRWEVASRRSNVGYGVGQGVGCDGDVEIDDYARAKEEGREVVRVPTRCSIEDYSEADSGKMIIDQFVAVHVSNDGKHLVALLNGSRLVIMHHFETFLVRRSSPRSVPATKSKHAAASTSSGFSPSPASASNSASTSSAAVLGSAAASASTSTALVAQQAREHSSAAAVQARRRSTRRRRHEARERRRREQDEKDEEIFVNTLDVQLGPPSASTSVYLAYENGRIGVVTSNAVYVVIPTIPSSQPSPPGLSQAPVSVPTSPTTTRRSALSRSSSKALSNPIQASRTPFRYSSFSHSLVKRPQPNPPNLSVFRIPYFSNPSWLTEVSCLMMSDTGLFLNWNPTWPRLGDELGGGGGAGAVVLGGDAAGQWTTVPGGAQLLGVGGGGGGGAGGVAGALDDGGGLIASLDVGAVDREELEERQQMMDQWEREYEQDLEEYERDEEGRYHMFSNGDMFVASAPRDLEESEVSTIYRVDFAPFAESLKEHGNIGTGHEVDMESLEDSGSNYD